MKKEEEKQLSSLITEASAEGRIHGRRGMPEGESAEGGERDAGSNMPVQAQSALEKEIRMLLLKAERYRYGVNGSRYVRTACDMHGTRMLAHVMLLLRCG